MKKATIIAAVLCVIFMIPQSVCAKTPELLITAPLKTTLSDGRYLVTIDLSGNTGFVSAQLELSYRSEVIACEKILPGEVLRGMLVDTNPCAAGDSASAILSAAGTKNITENGRLATFVFHPPQDGNPEFTLLTAELRGADALALPCTVVLEDNYSPQKPGQSDDEPDDKTGNGSGNKPGNSGSTGGSRPSAPVWDAVLPEKEKQPSGITIHDTVSVPTIVFSDVAPQHWAKAYIDEIVHRGVMNGYPDGTFSPDSQMTRAEFATMLWKLAGKPAPKEILSFADVMDGDWFFTPVCWAYESGYITGITVLEFAPAASITREQAMTILYRYFGSPSAAGLTGYADSGEISEYARAAMNWAVEAGILSGVDDMHLSPKSNASRAELSAMLVRAIAYMNRGNE